HGAADGIRFGKRRCGVAADENQECKDRKSMPCERAAEMHEEPFRRGKDVQKSLPGTKPSRGSQAAAQVAELTEAATKRTLPSPMATFMPPECPDCVRLGSHVLNISGRIWNRLQGAQLPGLTFLPTVLWHMMGRQGVVESAHSEAVFVEVPALLAPPESPQEPK